MKTIPLRAMSSFSAMVERVDLGFLTRLGVAPEVDRLPQLTTVSPHVGA